MHRCVEFNLTRCVFVSLLNFVDFCAEKKWGSIKIKSTCNTLRTHAGTHQHTPSLYVRTPVHTFFVVLNCLFVTSLTYRREKSLSLPFFFQMSHPLYVFYTLHVMVSPPDQFIEKDECCFVLLYAPFRGRAWIKKKEVIFKLRDRTKREEKKNMGWPCGFYFKYAFLYTLF